MKLSDKRKFKDFLNNFEIRGTWVVIAFALFVLMQVVMILFVIPTYSNYSKALPPEVRFGYGETEVVQYFDSLGGDGRNVYSLSNILDSILALLYGSAFASLIVFLSKKVIKLRRQRYSPYLILLTLIPLAGAMADLLENNTLFILLKHFPNYAPFSVLSTMASIFTGIKIGSYFLIVSTVIMLSLILFFLNIKIRIRNRREKVWKFLKKKEEL